MSDEWEIEKGRKIRVSTYSSDFEGTVVEYYTDDFLKLKDAEEVYDHLYADVGGGTWKNFSGEEGIDISTSAEREEYRRKIGKMQIPSDKINHYEFLDEEEREPTDDKYCTECGSKI